MLQVHNVQLYQRELNTRFPFRYGITSMSDVPHLVVEVDACVDGSRTRGVSADLLPPKWFTKDPTSSYRHHDLPMMLSVIRRTSATAVAVGRASTFFDWWTRLEDQQSEWATEQAVPPLLANFGVSLLERAVIDAMCRARTTTLYQLLAEDGLALDMGQLRAELAGVRTRDVISPQPLQSLIVRHTIGMGDALRESEIAAAERVHDGLPQSLVENIRRYGFTHFKIKVSGDLQHDRQRCHAIRQVVETEVGSAVRFTMDGNENFADMNSFRNWFEQLLDDPQLEPFFAQSLLFVEQPIHRDCALSSSVGDQLADWADAPLIIIDESDCELASLPTALELGYAGTSHKNCKGIVKGLVNAATIQLRRRQGATAILSAEDLGNLPPIALLQDLAMVAALGIEHVERNGHHYFAGMSAWPKKIQHQLLADMPDLFQSLSEDLVAVQVAAGRLKTQSVVTTPFGPKTLPTQSTWGDRLPIDAVDEPMSQRSSW